MITAKGYIVMAIGLMCLWACECIYKAIKGARKVDWKRMELDFSRVDWGYWVFIFVAGALYIAIQFVDEDDFK